MRYQTGSFPIQGSAVLGFPLSNPEEESSSGSRAHILSISTVCSIKHFLFCTIYMCVFKYVCVCVYVYKCTHIYIHRYAEKPEPTNP